MEAGIGESDLSTGLEEPDIKEKYPKDSFEEDFSVSVVIMDVVTKGFQL